MENVSAGKIGKYEIIKVLGRGGMGEVLLAQDIDLGRRVAIKRPFKSALEEGLARFQVEARAATLRHPNIPTVYEMGVQDGLPFIAMEFVEGEPLDKIIASGRPLDMITKLRIIEQVCSALGYAHANGIIHRDIKPANVIVQTDGVAKIIDFGIAKVQDGEGKAGLTQTSAVIGSLHYIAPERFKGGPIDGRVDIFSAGVTLFKLLTGEEPFTGGEATASYKIVNEAHSSLATYLHDYPPVLDEIVAKSLAKNPDDRYLTGEDFADALHDVIEDLKRTRVAELFDDAERLTTESRYVPALELLEEAAKLDPANTQVRKLRKFVREHQERLRRAERLRECTLKADEALLAGNFEEALNQLRDAQNLDPTSTDIRQKIQAVEEKKRRAEISAKALADAEQARNRGDVTAALRIVTRALQEDPDNRKLSAINGILTRQAEKEAQQGKILELLEQARRELTARNLSAAEKFVAEAESLDPAHLETDKLRRELTKIKEQEERRVILDEIQKRVGEFLRTESLDQAADLLTRALERLPNEALLHRLKAEVDAEVGKVEAKRFVEASIAQARELFANAPTEALSVLQKALDRMPGDERLMTYERSLRQQMDAMQVEQVRARTLTNARELMTARQYDKAVGVLESFLVEFGHHGDIDDLLTFARDEQKRLQRSLIVERSAAEGRALIRDGRLDEAARLLETGIQETGDSSLSRLLEEIREQQAAFARKLEVLHKRVALLRERGELNEAILLLEEQLSAMPGNPALQELLAALKTDRQQKQQAEFAYKIEAIQQRVAGMRQRGELSEAIQLLREQLTALPENKTLQELVASLQAELEQKQVTGKAIASARAAAQRKEFSQGLDSLQAVVRAYGESAELTGALQEIQNQRSAYADEVVGKSIETARAALLKNDSQGALAALKGATQWMEFADAKRQADWQRIGQSVKKALEQSGTTASSGAAFDAQLSAIASAKPKKFPVWIVAAGGVALVAVASLVIWRLKPPPSPPLPPPQAHIVVAKAPPGAEVRVDGNSVGLTDAQGNLSVPVSPGPHKLSVSKADFASFSDPDINVAVGEIFRDPATLTPLGNSGSLAVSAVGGNAAKIKVYVAGVYKGTVMNGSPLPLEVGTYKVHYSAPGFEDSTDKPVTISLKATTQDTYTLVAMKAPLPNVGNLTVSTNPFAHILLDNNKRVEADASGKYTFEGLTPGPHTVDVSLDKFVSVSGKPVQVQANQYASLDARMDPVTPTGFLKADQTEIEEGQSVNLNWQVNNASSVALDGSTVGPSGTKPVTPDHTTTYQLSANNGAVPIQSVKVTVRPKVAVVQPPPPQPKVVETRNEAPTLPDRATLESALKGYTNVFAQASGKSTKDCQSVFRGTLQGKLKDWAGTCDSTKSYEASEHSCQVGGSPDSPTLACDQTIVIHPKSGDPSPSNNRKTFRFTKGSDGSWQVSGW
jgi:eukaryotic-like serine/threonine-protein kinase